MWAVLKVNHATVVYKRTVLMVSFEIKTDIHIWYLVRFFTRTTSVRAMEHKHVCATTCHWQRDIAKMVCMYRIYVQAYVSAQYANIFSLQEY